MPNLGLLLRQAFKAENFIKLKLKKYLMTL